MENSVELLGHYGGDLEHALSAWCSTSRELTEEKRNRIDKLLLMLASSGHETPFEKSSLHFLVNTDIATHIHLLKHRVGVSCVAGDTEIYIPNPTCKNHFNSGVKKRTIKQLYEEHNFGIDTYSSTGKKYKRKYGRKIPVRTKEKGNNLIVKSYINNVFYNGKAHLYEFTTQSGKKIRTTLNHKFYSQDGEWVEIGNYLNVGLTDNNIAYFKNKNLMIATNGIILNDIKKPYTFKEFFLPYENIHTRQETAKLSGYKYSTIKKWGYIHNINFKKDENQNFKKNNKAWNKGVYGYKLNKKREKKGINPDINKNLDYKIWRATVGNWTREQLPKLLKDFHYTCQAQLSEKCSNDWNCHHVVPVSVDKNLATDYNNLALVCKNCHKIIHSSDEKEKEFAEQFYKQDLKILFKEKRKRVGKKLAFNYEEIISVEYIGYDDVYDLEIDNTHCYVANGFLIHNCNSESARYKELKEDKYLIPSDWDKNEQFMLEEHCKESLEKYHACYKRLLSQGVNKKRAKESARFYLPYANQITADVMFNFRSFVHFQRLRNSEHAQKEVREVAQKMLQLVKDIPNNPFQYTIKAFNL